MKAFVKRWLGLIRKLVSTPVHTLLVVSVSSAGWAASGQHGHGQAHAQPHSHGQASAEVSLEGGILRVEISGAMDNFLSYEHVPKTDAQRAELKKLQEALKDANWLAVPAAAAQCRSTAIRAESALFDQPTGGKGHADLEVSLTFECSNPVALTSIRFSALDKGRRMKRLMVEFAGPSGQRAVTLTQARPVLELK